MGQGAILSEVVVAEVGAYAQPSEGRDVLAAMKTGVERLAARENEMLTERDEDAVKGSFPIC